MLERVLRHHDVEVGLVEVLEVTDGLIRHSIADIARMTGQRVVRCSDRLLVDVDAMDSACPSPRKQDVERSPTAPNVEHPLAGDLQGASQAVEELLRRGI